MLLHILLWHSFVTIPSVESPETVRPQSRFVFVALSWWICVAALLCLLPSVAEGTVAFSWRYRDLLEVLCLAEGTVALLRRCRVLLRVPWACCEGAVSCWRCRDQQKWAAVHSKQMPLSILPYLNLSFRVWVLIVGVSVFLCVLTVVAWKIHQSVARDLV